MASDERVDVEAGFVGCEQASDGCEDATEQDEGARELTEAAGFTRFATHDLDDASNLYYEVRV